MIQKSKKKMEDSPIIRFANEIFNNARLWINEIEMNDMFGLSFSKTLKDQHFEIQIDLSVALAMVEKQLLRDSLRQSKWIELFTNLTSTKSQLRTKYELIK